MVVRSIQKVSGEAHPWEDVKAVSLTHRVWSALPILVFGFQCHTNVSLPTLLRHCSGSAQLFTL